MITKNANKVRVSLFKDYRTIQTYTVKNWKQIIAKK